MDIGDFRVKPGSRVDLSRWDPEGPLSLDKDDQKARNEERNGRLEELQELLYAQSIHSLLVVLQATDTAGKDSTIRHVFDGTNPQGVKVASFKRPTDEEHGHDFLWRVHKQAPKQGEITIFNRSHYEDVLVVRVHDLVPKERWKKRYDHINDFERMLADEGTKILKFFLHISKDEQKKRLQERLDEPHKNWKFERGDLAERAHWDDYQRAFEAMLEKTSTPHAPWYVVPANRKWIRNGIISEVLVRTLESLDMRYPDPEEGLDSIEIE